MAKKPADPQTFLWEGKDRSGNKSKGKIDADSLAAAKNLLRNQGISVKRVRKQSSFTLFNKANAEIKPLDIAFFTRQMATMMKAGVPIVQALDIVSGGMEKNKMKSLINTVKSDVSGGLDLSSSLGKYPLHFDDLFCNLVAAGERSGALEQMLDRLA
ncbi:MAG: type II secretion system F family protein, partial [Pontibacterium sp.]